MNLLIGIQIKTCNKINNFKINEHLLLIKEMNQIYNLKAKKKNFYYQKNKTYKKINFKYPIFHLQY